MPASDAKAVTITLDTETRVSGLLQAPNDARACYVLAHGAGAGMNHAFMAAIAAELSVRGIATLRYQFLYMENGGKRPDPLLDCDRDLWDLANEVLIEECERMHRKAKR